MKSPSEIQWPAFPGAMRWLNSLLRYSQQNELQSGVGYNVKKQPNGTTLELSRKSGGGTPGVETFTVSETSPLNVTVLGGTIVWRGVSFFVPDSAEIPVPANSTDFKVWVELNNAFAPTSATFSGAAGGWTDFPNQPALARKLLLLATITSDGVAVTDIDPELDGGWHGGDIVWPAVSGEVGDDWSVTVDGLNLNLNGGKVFWHNLDLSVPDSNAFVIPAFTIGWNIWLQMSDEFAVSPGLSFGSGAVVPVSTSPPARKYLHVLTVDSDATKITNVRKHFRGGTWPPIYGFHQ